MDKANAKTERIHQKRLIISGLNIEKLVWTYGIRKLGQADNELDAV